MKVAQFSKNPNGLLRGRGTKMGDAKTNTHLNQHPKTFHNNAHFEA